MSGQATRSRARRERGMALLGAMMIAVVVVSIAATVGVRSLHDISMSARLSEASSAGDLIVSVERLSRQVLRADARRGAADSNDEPWAQAALEARAPQGYAHGRLRELQGRFNLNNLAFEPAAAASVVAVRGDADSSGNATKADPRLIEDGDTAAPDPAVLALAGVSALAASMGGGAMPGGAPAMPRELTPRQVAIARFALLLRALDLDEALLPALLDWLDSDSDTRFPNGAEDDYYTELPQPYRAANRAFADLSELALVRGFDAEVRRTLAPYVTVLPGQTAINVNTAPVQVLMSLAPTIDSTAARMIDNARGVQPFRDLNQFVNLPVLVGRPLLAAGLTTASAYFELDTLAEQGRSTSRARTLLGRSEPGRVVVVQRSRGYVGD